MQKSYVVKKIAAKQWELRAEYIGSHGVARGRAKLAVYPSRNAALCVARLLAGREWSVTVEL